MWNFIQTQILGMKWLSILIGQFMSVLGLDIESRIGGSIHFFIYDVKEAVAAKEIDAEIEYITDMQKIMECGVMNTPALMIDGKIVSAGRAIKTKEIEKILGA